MLEAKRSQVGRLILVLAGATAACTSNSNEGNPDATNAPRDAAQPAADAQTIRDAEAAADAGLADAGSENGDATTPADGGGDQPTIGELQPIALPLSATGPDRLFGVTYDSAGSLYAVGQIADSTDSTTDVATAVVKLTSAGARDSNFGTDGLVRINVAVGTNGELFRGIVVQSTGKVVVSGTIEHEGAADPRDRDIALVRLNADGTRDNTFGNDGVLILDLSTGVVVGERFAADSVWGLALYPDDRLVIEGGQVRAGGMDTDFVLVRLLADGTRDPDFGTDGVFELDTLANGMSNNASPRHVTILPNDEGIIGAGYQPLPGADTAPVLFKVDNKGVLDTTFGKNGVFSEAVLAEQTECYAAAVQPIPAGGYALVTTGYGRQLETETTDLVSLRVKSDGTLDTSYGNAGLVRLDIGGFGDNSRNLMVLPDRRILLVGGGRPASANVDGLIGLLLPDGQPDPALSTTGFRTVELGGPADFVWSVALSPDHQTIAAVGVSGAGNSPTPPANDDSTLLLVSLEP